jgi:outer membrane receptor for monomeric catechols
VILSSPIAAPFTTTNKTSGETHGLELAPDWRVRADLDLAGAYSLLDMHLVGPNSKVAINSETAGKDVPTQQLNLRARWNVTSDVTFDPTLYYTGAQKDLGVPEYWLLNTRLGWKIIDGLQFSLVGMDLLHGAHREFTPSTDTTDPVIGRSFYGNLTWRY